MVQESSKEDNHGTKAFATHSKQPFEQNSANRILVKHPSQSHREESKLSPKHEQLKNSQLHVSSHHLRKPRYSNAQPFLHAYQVLHLFIQFSDDIKEQKSFRHLYQRS